MATIYKPTVTRIRGDDWTFDLTITQTDVSGVVTPFPSLSAATIAATIRNRDTDASVWTGTKAGGQITVTDEPNGKIRVSVPKATTATFQGRLYDGDVEVTAGGVTVTPVRFYLKVLLDATHV